MNSCAVLVVRYVVCISVALNKECMFFEKQPIVIHAKTITLIQTANKLMFQYLEFDILV